MAIFDHNVGNLTISASPQTITLGYAPVSVRVVNTTTGDQYYWTSAFAGTWTLKTTAAGVSTIDTNSLIVPASSDGGEEINAVTFAPGIGSVSDKAVYEVIR